MLSNLTALFHNSTFWYAIAFFAFVIIIVKFAKVPFLSWLDGEIEKIRSQLDNARSLRAEAEEMLASARKQHDEAVEEAKLILQRARDEVGNIRAHAETEINARISRLEQQAKVRIDAAEAAIHDAVRHEIIERSLEIAAEMFANKSDKSSTALINDQSIDSIKKLILTKAA